MMRNEDMSWKLGHVKLVRLAFTSSVRLRGDVRASAFWQTLWSQCNFQPRVSKIKQLRAEVRSGQVRVCVWLNKRQRNTREFSQIRDSGVCLRTALTLTLTAAAAVRGRAPQLSGHQWVDRWNSDKSDESSFFVDSSGILQDIHMVPNNRPGCTNHNVI